MSDPSTQGAGWHPDPSGQHQLRYWDGATWTDHVSDDGQQATDPIPPPPPGGVPAPQYGGRAQTGVRRRMGVCRREASASAPRPRRAPCDRHARHLSVGHLVDRDLEVRPIIGGTTAIVLELVNPVHEARHRQCATEATDRPRARSRRQRVLGHRFPLLIWLVGQRLHPSSTSSGRPSTTRSRAPSSSTTSTTATARER